MQKVLGFLYTAPARLPTGNIATCGDGTLKARWRKMRRPGRPWSGALLGKEAQAFEVTAVSSRK